MKPQESCLPGIKRPLRKPPDLHSPHILVVEDDDDIRRMNAEMLLQCGYLVDDAENGAVAWNALLSNSYDLVITDNKMPVLTGMELLEKMYAAQMAVPVIMVSGTMPWQELTESLWLQPVATLLKPYTFTELFEVVRMVLRARPDPDLIALREHAVGRNGTVKSFAE